VSDFLHGHTAYELIPESGKVVMLDVDLPVRQAFHALHEQVRRGTAGPAGLRAVGLSRTVLDMAAHQTDGGVHSFVQRRQEWVLYLNYLYGAAQKGSQKDAWH
jgi:hypothetical protein